LEANHLLAQQRSTIPWSLILLAALLIVFPFLTLSSVAEMPEKVAIHFSVDGAPDDWTTRERYRLLVTLFLIGFPLILVGVNAGLPLLTNGKGQIPNNEYWFANERRAETASFLLRHSCWLGCLTIAVIYGLHVLILRANTLNPPMLPTDRFITTIVVFLCGLAWWLMTYIRHFQRGAA
jgi:uncharacterized membrane protein